MVVGYRLPKLHFYLLGVLYSTVKKNYRKFAKLKFFVTWNQVICKNSKKSSAVKQQKAGQDGLSESHNRKCLILPQRMTD